MVLEDVSSFLETLGTFRAHSGIDIRMIYKLLEAQNTILGAKTDQKSTKYRFFERFLMFFVAFMLFMIGLRTIGGFLGTLETLWVILGSIWTVFSWFFWWKHVKKTSKSRFLAKNSQKYYFFLSFFALEKLKKSTL